EYATSMEMAGMSLSVLKLDDELKDLVDYKASTPFFTNINK
ncbi:MAG: dihydroxyacetone kinase subunit DhaK, partial [Clostridia bacterium]|nr:dihydroxyacetone kinase subunit DhaK [Clostridia bacterium]